MTLFTWKAERTIMIGILKWLSHWISQKKSHSTLKIHFWGFPSFNFLYRTNKTYLFIWFNAITVHIKTKTNKTWINITFTSRQSEFNPLILRYCARTFIWFEVKLNLRITANENASFTLQKFCNRQKNMHNITK